MSTAMKSTVKTTLMTCSQRWAALLSRAPARTLPTTFALVSAAAIVLALPSYASAELPDGRVYELVSPANKSGNLVRAGHESLGLAAEDGQAVVFVGTGAMGTAYDGLTEVFVARRSLAGWATSSTRPAQPGEINVSGGRPLLFVPSADFSRFLFSTFGPYVANEPANEDSSTNLFLSEDPTVEPTWIAKPTIAKPTPALGSNEKIHDYLVSGGTPDLGVVYFTYSGTLLPEDGPRTANVGSGMGDSETDPWGFYEWSHGVLAEAGVLPNGTLDPFGAVPAATAGGTNSDRNFASPFDQPETLNNQISADGTRAFFISPDPVASNVTDPQHCQETPPCSSAPPELYLRETTAGGAQSTLISQSQLPGHAGEPAPDGPISFQDAPVSGHERVGGTYVYASPDGSHAFFASTDQLTSSAPGDSTVKYYEYDVQTGALTYLPDITGSIVASAPDGSELIFENAQTAPAELDLWTSGTNGGNVSAIAQLPIPINVGEPFDGQIDVSAGRASADGSAFVFSTNSPLAGFNNAGGYAQVYHYSVGAHELTCVSCPGPAVSPSGDASVSHNESNEPLATRDARVISSDGSRVFFDTPDPLVTQDANTTSKTTPEGEKLGRDVYEWENGDLQLISSGRSLENSYVLDSSANGSDLFFTTSAGLQTGDVDEARDVYDARIPRLGDRPAPPPLPCDGSLCQGGPSAPLSLTAPPSATTSGLGNLAPGGPALTKPKPLTRVQKLAIALRLCARKPKAARRSCARHAHKRYGATSHSANRNGRRK